MRRQLDLTPRQVAALDSIERALDRQNQGIAQRLRARRDSILPDRREDFTREDRLALRSRLDSLTPLRRQMLRNDSTARVAALRVLTDSQRTRVRELQAERRGFAMGQALQRGRGQGMGGRDVGPRTRMGRPGLGMRERPLRGRMGLDGPRALRGRFGPGIGGRGLGQRIGPGFRGRFGGPDGFGMRDRFPPNGDVPMRGMRRLRPPMDDLMPDDSLPPPPRRSVRRPPADSIPR